MEQKNPVTDTTFKLIESGEKYLITADSWFFGPDGQLYRAVYGRCWILEAERVMGFRPVRATNWYVLVRGTDTEMIVAGCEMHYALRLKESPIILEGTNYDGKNETPINSILILK